MKRLALIVLVMAAGTAGVILSLRHRSSGDGTASPSSMPRGTVSGTNNPSSSPSEPQVPESPLSRAAKRFDAGGWDAVMAEINASFRPETRGNITVTIADRLILADPSRMTSILEAIPLGSTRVGLLQELAAGPPEVSRRVLEWVLDKGYPEEIETACGFFSMRSFTMEDEALLDKLLDDQAHASSRPLLFTLKVRALAGRGEIGEVGRLLSEFPEQSLPIDYASSVMGGLRRGGHLNAETLSSSSLPPAVQESGWKQLAYEATNGDEPSGIEWINQNVPSDHRAAAAGALFSRWVPTDPMAASEAIRALPPGAVKDGGIRNLVGYLKSKGDVAAAADWEAQLSPPK